jgi:hypothetical protein
MKKILLDALKSKIKSSPNFKKTALVFVIGSLVFLVLFAGAGIWAISKTYNYIASSPKSSELMNTARNLALSPPATISPETITSTLDKPLLSQNCIDSSINLINPSLLLTKPINELLSNFKTSCLRDGNSENNKTEASTNKASERI